MTTHEILQLDYRLKENQFVLDTVLRKIKPFANYDGEITTEMLEKFLSICTNKYEVYFRYITCSFDKKSYDTIGYYSCEVEISIEGKVKQLETIHAGSIRELFAKISIFVFSKIRNGNIKLKFDDDV